MVEKKDGKPAHGAAGSALRLRLVDELEERLVATLGRQAASLETVVADLRLAISAVDRLYAGVVILVELRDVRDLDARRAQLEQHVRLWREATHRLWQDGGPVFAPDEGEGEKPEGG